MEDVHVMPERYEVMEEEEMPERSPERRRR